VVVVAEGDKIGKNVFELADYVEENMTEYEVRVSVLGHMQRGGHHPVLIAFSPVEWV
jgi:6-phosphofructokinase 1